MPDISKLKGLFVGIGAQTTSFNPPTNPQPGTVQTDGISIGGNGSRADFLSADSIVKFLYPSDELVAAAPGAPMYASAAVVTDEGIQESVARLARANDIETTRVLGLKLDQPAFVVSEDLGPNIPVVFAGTVFLQPSVWAVVIGNENGAGIGLTPGAVYYLSSTVSGRLTKTPPSVPGTFVAKVGIATSNVALVLQIADPIANEG